MSVEGPLPDLARIWSRDGKTSRRASVEGGRALFRLHGRLVRLRNRNLFEFGLTSAQLRILDAMARSPRANLSTLAERLDLTRQAVHRVVHDLVRQGFIELRRDPEDRRAVVPATTEFGQIYAESAIEWQEAVATDLTSILRLQDLQFVTITLDRLRQELL